MHCSKQESCPAIKAKWRNILPEDESEQHCCCVPSASSKLPLRMSGNPNLRVCANVSGDKTRIYVRADMQR
eukprot:11160632-Lingulodinium_polyedra.AAC.1